MVCLALSVDVFWDFTGKAPSKYPLCYIGHTYQEQPEGWITIYGKKKQPAWNVTIIPVTL